MKIESLLWVKINDSQVHDFSWAAIKLQTAWRTNQDRALAKIDEEFHFLKKNHMVSIGMNFKFMSLIVLN